MNDLDWMKGTLCILMAGGRGERLYPLTKDYAKPAVRFGGIYRIIDFTLSNCLNSHIRKVYVLTQYRSVSLERHIRLGWNIFNHELGEFIECVPPQLVHTDHVYRGTADSLYQNIQLLQMERPERVLILSGDHVYKMNYNAMIKYHVDKGADLTVAGVEVPIKEAGAFGVMGCDDEYRIVDWEEKPKHPRSVPGNPEKAFVSMGVYVFNTEVLVKRLYADVKKTTSSHDFGKDIVPAMVKPTRVFVYGFHEPIEHSRSYWKDIGTLDAYWEANMDLTLASPQCNLYEKSWPIRTYQPQVPPAKTVSENSRRVGSVVDSVISGGCVVSGGKVIRSVLSPRVRVEAGAVVEDSVLLEGVTVGRGAKVKRAIVDQEVQIPESYTIGHDPRQDEKLFTISPGGVVAVPRGIALT